MKKIAVASFLVLLATSAFAADKSTVNMSIDHPAVITGTTLQPGDYKIQLDRNGDQVQATFITHGKTVATKSGHFEARPSLPDGVSLVTKNSDKSVKEIGVKKMKGAIVFDQASAETPSSTGSN
jgi:hypothetical protein